MKKFNLYAGCILFLVLLSFFSCNQSAEQKKNTEEEISNLPKPTPQVEGAKVTLNLL